MARYTGPKCRQCRREGAKLFLKGERCDSPKCALGRRDYPPGMQSFFRSKVSDYGLQLREKQKVKRFYGVLEKQFRKYFKEAERIKGNTGENLLKMLELRLDNVLVVGGMAFSRSEARQMVNHGHIRVNGRKVDIASYMVSPDDVVSIRANAKSVKLIKGRMKARKGAPVASWVSPDADSGEVKILQVPEREDVSVAIQEQLVVELCSK